MEKTNVHIDISKREQQIEEWEEILSKQGILPAEGILNSAIYNAIPVALATLDSETTQNSAKNYLIQSVLVALIKSTLDKLPENTLTEKQHDSFVALISEDMIMPTTEEFTTLFKRSNPKFEEMLDASNKAAVGGGKGTKQSLASQKVDLGVQRFQETYRMKNESRKEVLKATARDRIESLGNPNTPLTKEEYDRLMNGFSFEGPPPVYSSVRGSPTPRRILLLLLLLINTGKVVDADTRRVATYSAIPRPSSSLLNTTPPSTALAMSANTTLPNSKALAPPPARNVAGPLGPILTPNVNSRAVAKTVGTQLASFASGTSVAVGHRPVAPYNPPLGAQIGEIAQRVISSTGLVVPYNPYGVTPTFITPELESIYSQINLQYERTLNTLTRYEGGLQRIPIIEYNSIHNIFSKIKVGTLSIDKTLPNMATFSEISKPAEIHQAVLDIANYNTDYTNVKVTIVPKVVDATWFSRAKTQNVVDKILISYTKNARPCIIKVAPIDIDAMLTPFAYRMLFDEDIVPDVSVLTQGIDKRLQIRPTRSGFWSKNTNVPRYVAALEGANSTTRLVVSSFGRYSQLQYRVAELSYADSLIKVANAYMEDPSNPTDARRAMNGQVQVLVQRMNELSESSGDIIAKAANILTEFGEGIERLTTEEKDESFWKDYRQKTADAFTKTLTDVVDGTLALTNAMSGLFSSLGEAAKDLVKHVVRSEVIVMVVALFGADIISQGSGWMGVLSGAAVVQPLFGALSSSMAAIAVEKGLNTINPLLHLLSSLAVYLIVVRNLRPARGRSWWEFFSRSSVAAAPQAAPGAPQAAPPAPQAAPQIVAAPQAAPPAPQAAPHNVAAPQAAPHNVAAPAQPYVGGPLPFDPHQPAVPGGYRRNKRRTMRRRVKRSRNTRRR